MAEFKYKARSFSGEDIKGVVEADDQFEAVAKVKQTCPVILEMEEVSKLTMERTRAVKKVDDKTLSLICDRFATLLKVGLPVVKCVEMLSRQMEDKALCKMLKDISTDVAMGRSLFSSFSVHENVFPTTFLESIRSGEESGELDKTFTRLKVHYERTSKTKQKVMSALSYPAFTMVVAVVVIVIIMVVAIPTFSQTFETMGTEMPAVTKMLITISNFLINYGLYLGILLIVAFLALRTYMRTEQGAETVAAFLIAIPIIGPIIQLSAASQFAHTMSMMLSSGMPILSCIMTAGRGVSNYVMRRDILEAADDVEEGKSLGTCLGKSKFLPPMLVEMTVMGEETGTLETTLEAVGNFYDNEVDIATNTALSVLEPAIISVLAVVVVFILFSVYLPMFSMYGGM